MRKTLFVALMILCATMSYAQPAVTIDTFAPLESQGNFPAALKTAANTPKSAKTYNPFLVAMLKQGKILYGTELNAYLDNITEKLLVNHPQLQNKIHVYILQSPVVNAFSMNDGTILMTMGLLAQATNESELAFVLAHEIAHYSERHGMSDDRERTKSRDIVSEYMRYHMHSREQEFDADRIGLTQFFKDSPYSFEILDGLFDLLLYSDLPFDEIPYPRSEVETEFYQFPDNYFLKTTANIPDRANIIDTLLSHPNIERRRTLAKAQAAQLPNDGRKVFVQPEETFTRLRDVARFACIDYYLVNHQYDKAIYNIFVLQQQQPGNAFLTRSLATAWYGSSKHKNYGQFSAIVRPYRQVEGEMQQVSYLMSKLNRTEYTAMALRKAWAAWRSNPQDNYLQSVVNDLINDLFVKQKMRYIDFCDYPQGTSLDEIAQSGEDTTRYNSKYDRIKQQNMNVKVLPEPKFKTVNYMLVDIHSDSLFRAMVNDVVVNAETRAMLNEVSENHIGNAKSLLIMTPVYHTYGKNGNIRNAATDRRNAERLRNLMCRSVKRMGITPVTFDMDFQQPETEQYNHFVKLCLWNEDFVHANALDMRYHTSEYLDKVAASLGTRKLCFVAVSDAAGRGFFGNKLTVPWLAPVFPYTLPFVIGVLALRTYDVDVNCLFLDIVDGKVESAGHYSQSEVMRKAYINGYVYQQLEQYIRR